MNNPILKYIKNNDIVLFELPSTERTNIKEIVRIYNLNFIPADDGFKFDWLEFEGEILYTNIRLHHSMINKPIGNCLAITEIIPNDFVEQYARANDLWKATDFLLSDNELEQKRNYYNNG